jgi:hypothetical protein
VVGFNEAPSNFGNPLLELHLERVDRVDQSIRLDAVAELKLDRDDDLIRACSIGRRAQPNVAAASVVRSAMAPSTFARTGPNADARATSSPSAATSNASESRTCGLGLDIVPSQRNLRSVRQEWVDGERVSAGSIQVVPHAGQVL